MESQNRRDYLRADIALRARCHILDPQERDIFDKGLGSTLLEPSDSQGVLVEFLDDRAPESKDDPVFQCFRVINNKLDFMIDQLLSSNGSEARFSDRVTEISGSGLKFISARSFEPGQLIRMELIVPESLQFRIGFIGEVMRVEKTSRSSSKKGAEFLVAVRFLEIEEEARDCIIKAVFKKQRQVIRMRKATQES